VSGVDTDGDGCKDTEDACPTGAASGVDTDGDGCKNATEDTDDDGDGVTDTADACPIGAASGTDTDADGCKDTEDVDDDGVTDSGDNCALVANPGQANADGDAQGDACDPTNPPAPSPVTPGPGAVVRDLTKPVITLLTLSPSSFRASGTRVSVSVSEASSVRFTVQRKTTGRRVGASCAAQTRANRTKRACTRWVAVKGSFTIPATAGSNSVTFRGRIGGTTLKPGSYRLNSQASDTAGNASAIKRQSFRIVK
jgi:hypothetical protein